MICSPLPKTLNTCDHLLINKNTYVCFRFCNIRAELFDKGLCSWPIKNRTVDLKGVRGPRLSNPDLSYVSVGMLQNLIDNFTSFQQVSPWKASAKGMKTAAEQFSKSTCQFITQTKAALLLFIPTWHVTLHKFDVSLINLCKHTNKCPIFPQYTFPFTFLINI